jgi:hypothetical protein
LGQFNCVAAAKMILRMAQSNFESFIGEAEECVRQAERAADILDKLAWLRLAEQWLNLALAVRNDRHKRSRGLA